MVSINVYKFIPFSGVNFRSVGEIGWKELEEEEETWGSLCGLDEGNDEITGGRRVLERTSAHCGARAATTDAAHFASSAPHMFRISCETYPADCPRAHARGLLLFRNFSAGLAISFSAGFPFFFFFFLEKKGSSFSSPVRIILFLWYVNVAEGSRFV